MAIVKTVQGVSVVEGQKLVANSPVVVVIVVVAIRIQHAGLVHLPAYTGSAIVNVYIHLFSLHGTGLVEHPNPPGLAKGIETALMMMAIAKETV